MKWIWICRKNKVIAAKGVIVLAWLGAGRCLIGALNTGVLNRTDAGVWGKSCLLSHGPPLIWKFTFDQSCHVEDYGGFCKTPTLNVYSLSSTIILLCYAVSYATASCQSFFAIGINRSQISSFQLRANFSMRTNCYCYYHGMRFKYFFFSYFSYSIWPPDCGVPNHSNVDFRKFAVLHTSIISRSQFSLPCLPNP